MKQMHLKNTQKGFTLIEFIVYFAMTLIMLGIIAQITLNLLDSKEKIKAYEEVGRSGRNALNAITEAISESESVLGTSESPIEP
jgi:Tfp pilus assembly protein PilW